MSTKEKRTTMTLSFYVDSAVPSDIDSLIATGMFRGVTTNPTLLDRAGLTSADIPDFVASTLDRGAERVFVQSWGATPDEIAARGREFRSLSDRVIVKVPGSREGITAAKLLSGDGEVLVTAIYSAGQIPAVLASGAAYTAPFLGRMIAAGRDGIAEVQRMQAVIDGTRSDLRLLVGSLRTPEQIVALASVGVRDFTMGAAVWDQFFVDELTAATVAQFEELATATP
jgi:fructose-6-phosphate aldolase 1